MSSTDERITALDAQGAATVGLDEDSHDQAQTLRALRHLVQALSITQNEHTATLERHTQVLGRLEAGQRQIIELLNRLIVQE